MLDKLKEAEKRYVAMEEELADPAIFSQPDRYATLMKDYKSLTPVIETYREYRRAADAKSRQQNHAHKIASLPAYCTFPFGILQEKPVNHDRLFS